VKVRQAGGTCPTPRSAADPSSRNVVRAHLNGEARLRRGVRRDYICDMWTAASTRANGFSGGRVDLAVLPGCASSSKPSATGRAPRVAHGETTTTPARGSTRSSHVHHDHAREPKLDTSRYLPRAEGSPWVDGSRRRACRIKQPVVARRHVQTRRIRTAEGPQP